MLLVVIVAILSFFLIITIIALIIIIVTVVAAAPAAAIVTFHTNTDAIVIPSLSSSIADHDSEQFLCSRSKNRERKRAMTKHAPMCLCIIY